MKDQVKMRDLCWISCFCCFSVLFMYFCTKSATFHENQQNQVNMCVYMYHLHIHAPPNTTKYKIYLVGLPSVLYERPGQNERSVLNQLFLLLFMCFSCAFDEKHHFSCKKCHTFMKTNKTRSICVYTCTIYTYMHHQIPPKYKIYLVGLPSVLYERPGQNERSVLNQLFLLFFRCAFHVLFIQKVPLFMKTNKTRSICVYTCTIYTYMHHIYTTKYHQNIRYT